MDQKSVKDVAQDLATKFVSLDKVEFDSVINEYFDTNCKQISRLAEIQGVSRIKKLAALEAIIASDSHLIGNVNYDPKDEIIKFSWERTFKPPAIPSIVPLSHCVNHQLEKFALKSTWDSQLHMNAARDEQGETKLYVTKVGPTKRRNTTWFEDILPFFLIRPIISFFFILVSDVVSTISRHPVAEESQLGAFLSIVAELFEYDTSGDKGITSKRIITWPVHFVFGVFSLFIGSVQSSISFVHNALHLDSNPIAQLVSICEDCAIRLISVIFSSVRHIALSSINVAENTAKSYGVPVDEYHELAERKVEEAVKLLGRVKDEPQNSGNGSLETHRSSQEPGAPSYAEAVKE
ncbi:uncharacterized protein IAS62_001955 [Cryptococcus decagattii]|uniref:Uncharacterized protein n=1 Tax=Cryptococcus decagattii TaxID=1859122 RepID=A0ABZ2ATY7_9TREE